MVCERVTKEGRLGNLAEFGCGTGFYTEILASKAHSVVATDVCGYAGISEGTHQGRI